ncbi:MAG: TlpA family protein disulfide reductase [Planctomycetaceae bacterium]|nr:TlpA family protein disulfide reductase [Planctomycetaceae bacterium]
MKLITIVLGIVILSAPGLADDDQRVISGHVVDQNGNAVEGVDVTTFWNANGITRAETEQVKEKPIDEGHWIREGEMEPWGTPPIKTDGEGKFSLTVHEDDFKIMVQDAERRRGGVGMINPDDPDEPIEIVLQPLVKVHGQLRVSELSATPEWTGTIVCLPTQESFPVGRDRVAFCGSARCRFVFMLPPGDYVLGAYNEPTDENGEQRVETVRDVVFHVPVNQTDVDLGVVLLEGTQTWSELVDELKARGEWKELSQRFGEPAPEWHADDVGGAAEGVQTHDYRGKWLVVYFWGPSCVPCLKSGLPSLLEFSEKHADHRDQFQIIAVCLDRHGSMRSISDIDQMLKPIIQNVWGGRSPDFPILLDNTSETIKRFGLDSLGHLVLIDPDGNLRKGDLNTLEERLQEISE